MQKGSSMANQVIDLKEEKENKTAAQLPEPSGYKLLITIPEIESKTSGGILKPDKLIDEERVSSVVGFVTKVGPDAYQNKERFPSGPWCKEGDFVLFRAFQGTRIKIHGQEFRLINDDTVEAVVDDPRGYSRA